MSTDALERFLPAVQLWFRSALGEPTAAQRQGWPSIAGARHTLIWTHPEALVRVTEEFLGAPA